MGVPLTIDLFGGSVLSVEQYQAWKVVHGYGVFLAFINYFVGMSLDRLALTHREQEATSWCFLLTGLVGGVVRMLLLLLSALSTYGLYASLGETVAITLGTALFVRGQVRSQVPAPRPPAYAGSAGGRQTAA
jgi:hypothetical protein